MYARLMLMQMIDFDIKKNKKIEKCQTQRWKKPAGPTLGSMKKVGALLAPPHRLHFSRHAVTKREREPVAPTEGRTTADTLYSLYKRLYEEREKERSEAENSSSPHPLRPTCT